MKSLRILIIQLVAPLLLIKLSLAEGNGQEGHNSNIRFDPDDDGNTVSCTIAPYTDVDNYFKPKEGQCLDPNSTSTGNSTTSPLELSTLPSAALQRLAVAYAPVLFFHPLEKYSLSSVDATFAKPSRGKIYQRSKGDVLIDDQLNLTTLLKTSRDPVWALKSSSFHFTLEEHASEMYDSKPEDRFGDGYDDTGKSKAKIYYNAFDSGNGTWTINYWLYYEYNGEGNQGVVTTSEGNDPRYIRYQLRPYGVHEGDWENLSVMFCPPASVADIMDDALSEPLAVHYRQHSWSHLTDCTRGECKFYKETHHPVGFVALNSHATYVDSANDLIYINQGDGFFFNLQAFLIVDRTMYKKADGSYNYFMPNVNNLEGLQNPADLTLEAKEMEAYFWQGFGGNWGRGDKIGLAAEPPVCLAEDQLSVVECPTAEEDPIFDVVMQLMTVPEPRNDLLGFVQQFSALIVEIYATSSVAPNGPVTKHYYEDWVKPDLSPFWEKESNTSLVGKDYCTSIMDIPNITQYGVGKMSVQAVDQVQAMILMVAILTVLNFVLPLLALIVYGKDHYQPIALSEEGVPQPATWLGHFQYSVGAWVYTVFFLIMVAAGIVFLKGSNSLLDLMEEVVKAVDWSLIRDFVSVLAICIVVGNSLLLVFMWLQVFEMQRMIRLRYLQLTGAKNSGGGAISWDETFVPWNPAVVAILFKLCFAILFVSLMLSMICVVLGVAVVGFAAAFVQACNKVSGSLDNVCIDLNFVGIPTIACGDDFQDFCNQWARAETVMILWASFFVFVSHFYVIAATGFAAQQRLSIPAILAFYPDPVLEEEDAVKPTNEIMQMPTEETYRNKVLAENSED